MINILLCGSGGKMGNAVRRVAENDSFINIAAGYDINNSGCDFPVYDNLDNVAEDIDCIIDFSHFSLTDGILDFAKAKKIPAVICTTGLSKEQISKINFYSKEIPIFFSANMSIGVNLIIDLVQKASKVLESNFDIEIIEKHHNQKLDAPSGTALMIADGIKSVREDSEYIYDRTQVRQKRAQNEIGIHAVRGGSIVGEHEVLFAGRNENITLRHSALSREVFADGALKAAEYLKGKGAGMYNMSNVLEELI